MGASVSKRYILKKANGTKKVEVEHVKDKISEILPKIVWDNIPLNPLIGNVGGSNGPSEIKLTVTDGQVSEILIDGIDADKLSSSLKKEFELLFSTFEMIANV